MSSGTHPSKPKSHTSSFSWKTFGPKRKHGQPPLPTPRSQAMALPTDCSVLQPYPTILNQNSSPYRQTPAQDAFFASSSYFHRASSDSSLLSSAPSPTTKPRYHPLSAPVEVSPSRDIRSSLSHLASDDLEVQPAIPSSIARIVAALELDGVWSQSTQRRNHDLKSSIPHPSSLTSRQHTERLSPQIERPVDRDALHKRIASQSDILQYSHAAAWDDQSHLRALRSSRSCDMLQDRSSRRLGCIPSNAEHVALNQVLSLPAAVPNDDDELSLEEAMASYYIDDEMYTDILATTPATPATPILSACPSPVEDLAPIICVTDEHSWPLTPKDACFFDQANYFTDNKVDVLAAETDQVGIGSILDLFPALPASSLMP